MGKDRLIVVNREKSKLPYELPPNLVYWIRCETRVRPEETVVTLKELENFYRTRVAVSDSLQGPPSVGACYLEEAPGEKAEQPDRPMLQDPS